MVKDNPLEQKEASIRTDTINEHDVVKIASTSDSGLQSQTSLHQGGGSMIGNVLSAASSGRSGSIDTEFGSTGAPTFLKRQMPVYPALARKLGKEGKVVLRLFIDEKEDF
ncbi:MAG: hypothetical protein ACUVUQ_11560 [Thermodesulfovibrionales bacterium]